MFDDKNRFLIVEKNLDALNLSGFILDETLMSNVNSIDGVFATAYYQNKKHYFDIKNDYSQLTFLSKNFSYNFFTKNIEGTTEEYNDGGKIRFRFIKGIAFDQAIYDLVYSSFLAWKTAELRALSLFNSGSYDGNDQVIVSNRILFETTLESALMLFFKKNILNIKESNIYARALSYTTTGHRIIPMYDLYGAPIFHFDAYTIKDQYNLFLSRVLPYYFQWYFNVNNIVKWVGYESILLSDKYPVNIGTYSVSVNGSDLFIRNNWLHLNRVNATLNESITPIGNMKCEGGFLRFTFIPSITEMFDDHVATPHEKKIVIKFYVRYKVL